MIAKVDKTVPELRFSEFDEDWDFPLLDSIAVRGSGHTPSKDFPEYYDGEIDWISLADSKLLDSGYISNTKSRISELGLANSSAVLHPPETVILSRDAGVGKSAVMKHSMAVSQHFIAWRPIDDVSCSWFLYYWLQIQKREFERIAIGSTIKTIGLPYFKKLRIPIPALPEQRKIANFITAVDKRIEQLIQKKALLEDYKKGVMQQLFTQAIRFKDDHGNDFPDWEEKKLGDFTDCTAGGTPRTTRNEFWGGEIRWMNSGELNLKTVSEVEGRITNLGLKGSSTKMLPKFCVLVGLAGQGKTRGTVAYNTVELCTNQSIAAIIPNDSFNWNYLYHNLDFRYEELRRLSTGDGGRGGLNLTLIRGIKVPFPMLPEQTKIANFLSAIDSKIESVGTQITETQTFKRGLLQQMFV